ncbi:MAG: biosynthetic arginine decarboxylase [Proteobacteria bacterium]|nr:biosynthetic arginine decarboxylase [Pseudomonadota bacterium]MBU1737010.1 biosynthetic arginine decarboxylase [Pseudomonadota bacterium]
MSDKAELSSSSARTDKRACETSRLIPEGCKAELSSSSARTDKRACETSRLLPEGSETKISAADACELYNVERWGSGYFSINDSGHLCVLPERDEAGPRIDFLEVVNEIRDQNIAFPAVIRFQDILRSQVKLLNTTFREAIAEYNYQGRFFGVYPIKVNQMREVVEEILDAGEPYNHGLEAGSKSELMAALAYNENNQALTVLNGYKDEEYVRLALLGRKLGRRFIIVVENISEFDLIVRISKEMKVKPLIGIRSKLAVKGGGRWAGSSGERAKFGLTCSEILSGIAYLKSEGFADCLQLLHFHVGSQVPDIRIIKEAVAEAGRIYADLALSGIKIQYFDVGGGLGVDYDGSRSANNSSRNYSLQEYAQDIVSGIQQICDEVGVPHPDIISESGRYITAHHSCVVTNVVDTIHQTRTTFETGRIADEHILLTNTREAAESLTEENFQEIFNDVQQSKDDAITAFKLGVISLNERAMIETLYWQVISRISRILETIDFVPEELTLIEELKASQYLCNFSVFQSAADTWAISQLLPIMPITRLDEKPQERCSIVDITCDSDGKISHFIPQGGHDQSLLLHSQKRGEDYFIGLFLTGAYQDVMGDMHNLFGRLNEVHIYCDDDDPADFYIEEVIKGTSAEKVLETMQYNPDMMARSVKKEIDRQIRDGNIQPREGVRLIDFYEECLEGYTYLKF